MRFEEQKEGVILGKIGTMSIITVIPQDIWEERNAIMKLTELDFECFQDSYYTNQYGDRVHINRLMSYRKKLLRFKKLGIKPYKEQISTDRIEVDF